MLNRVMAIVGLSLSVLHANGQWQNISVPGGATLYGVHYRANGNVWVTQVDTVRYSLDAGDTFTPKPVLDAQSGLSFDGQYNAVHAFNNNEAVVAGLVNSGLGRAMLRSDDAGDGFVYAGGSAIPLETFFDMEFRQAPIGIVVGSAGAIYRSTDGGLAWSSIPPVTAVALRSVAWVGGSTYLACGDGALLRSTDDGATWSVVPGPNNLKLLSSLGGGVCYASTTGAQVLKSTDSGTSWTPMGGIPGAQASALEILDANTLILATDVEGLFRSTTSGQYWERFDLPDYERVRALSFYDADNGLAVGEQGYVLRTANAGGPALPLAAADGPTGAVCEGSTLLFTSLSDPAYAHAWTVDGVQVATTYTYSTAALPPGNHVVQLEISNGFASDVVVFALDVLALPVVQPFVITMSSDTICPNAVVNITIPQTTQGALYRLYANNVPIGLGTTGSGGQLVLSTGAVPITTTFTVRGTLGAICGTDTFDVIAPIVVFSGSPGTTWDLVQDSICFPGQAIITLQATLPGCHYEWVAQPWVAQTATVVGTGGVVQLPVNMPMVFGGVQSYTLSVRAFYPGIPQCFAEIGADRTLVGFGRNLTTTLRDSTLVVGGTIDLSSLLPVGFAGMQWSFGSGAVPTSFAGNDPPPVVFTQAGQNNLVLSAIAPDSVCVVQRSATVIVLDAPQTVVYPRCAQGSVPDGVYVTDMHLDGHNNRYLTGMYPSNGSPRFFAMKLDSAGNKLWEYKWVSNGWSVGMGITADEQGNAYVTCDGLTGGWLGRYVDRNVVAKFGYDGNVDWTMTSADLDFRGIACIDDRLHIAGYGGWSGAELRLADGSRRTWSATTDSTGGEAFLITLDTDGAWIGADAFGRYQHVDSAGVDRPLDLPAGLGNTLAELRTDPHIEEFPNGDLLLSGIMRAHPYAHQCWFGSVLMQNNCGTDTLFNARQVYAVVYDPQQGPTQAFTLLGGTPRTVQRLSRAADGTYRFAGRADSVLVEGANIVGVTATGGVQPGLRSGYIAKAQANGQIDWMVASDRLFPYDVQAMDDGSSYVLGAFKWTGLLPSVGTGPFGVTSAGSLDAVVAHYGANGQLLELEQTGTAQSDIAFRAEQDVCGNLHTVVVSTPANNFLSLGACNNCPATIAVATLGTGACGSTCFAAYDPTSTDVSLDRLWLSDTTLNNPAVRSVLVDLSGKGQVAANQITVALQVNNDPVTTVTWNGLLPYAGRLDSLALGTLDPTVRNHHRIRAWIVEVNSAADDDQRNDTLTIEQLHCSVPLAGTYTLGGPGGGDIGSFRVAGKLLTQCGVSAPTTIAVQDGRYHDQLVIGPIPGSSVQDSVVIRSASVDSAAVTLVAFPYFAFNCVDLGGSHVSLVDLGLKSEDHDNVRYGGVLLRDTCRHVNIEGCLIHTNALYPISTSAGNAASHFLARGNILRGGFMGLDYVSPMGSAITGSFCRVENNLFDGQGDGGLLISTADPCTIRGNVLLSDSTRESQIPYSAIKVVQGGAGPLLLTGNNVRYTGPARPAAGLTGLMNINSSGTGPARSLIANNMVAYPGLDSLYLGLIAGCGPGSEVDIVHNTLDGGVQLVNMQGANGDLVFRNNIALGWKNALTVFGTPGLPGFDIDQNVYWSRRHTSGDSLVMAFFTPYTLSQWSNAFGFDWSSWTLLPDFVAPDDLHLLPGNYFSCTPFPGITEDIDGDFRNPAVTRQGADEGDASVAVQEDRSNTELLLAPNPGHGKFSITGLMAGPVEVLVTDAAGRVVAEQLNISTGGRMELTLDVRPGAYQVCVTNNGEVSKKALVVVGRE